MKESKLDEMLKAKLQDVALSPELELKLVRMIEQQRIKAKQKIEQETSIKEEVKNQEENRKKSFISKIMLNKNLGKIISIAAVVLIIFTFGLNFKNINQIINKDNQNSIIICGIEPTKLEAGILANDSEFILKVEGKNVNKEAVQKSLYVDPPLEYDIEKTLNKSEYKLKFKQNIPDNTIIKLQYVKNQITENSWAYQTSNKLTVNNCYPTDGASEVNKYSVIEIELSYADVEGFEENISIAPEVEGNWEHLGNTFRFIPTDGLKMDTTYEVLLKNGIRAKNEILENDFKFKFTTGENKKIIDFNKDTIFTAKTDENPKIIAYNNAYFSEVDRAKLEKFENVDDFMNFLENNEIKNTKKYKDVEVEILKGGEFTKYIGFKRTLEKGYYLATIIDKNETELYKAIIQISDISAYCLKTQKDIMVWTAKDNNLAQNIDVEFEGNHIKTDKDGIAKFTNVCGKEDKTKYLKIENELILATNDSQNDDFNKRAYMYTDKLIYKNTDTINIWGYVPISMYNEDFENEFYLKLENESKKKINIDKDGTFTEKIELNNHKDEGEAQIILFYKDEYIASEVVSINQYELKNYIYEVDSRKDFVYSSEEFEFDVKVKHITGLIVPNKTVVAVYNDREFVQKTGNDGVAHFKIKMEDSFEETSYPYIEIYNDNKSEFMTSLALTRFKNDVTYQIDENEFFKVTLNKLDNREIKINQDKTKLYNGVYETNVEISLKEGIWKRKIVNYEYNEYIKQNIPVYERELEENISFVKNVISKNGIVELSKNEINIKKDTEDKEYFYNVILKYYDTNMKETINEIPLDIYNYSDIYPILNSENYRYFLKPTSEVSVEKYEQNELYKLKINDTINFKLVEETEDGLKEIENNGKLLIASIKENIINVNTTTENNINIKFSDNYFPNFNLVSAYFVDGKFYKISEKRFDVNEEDKKIDIEISTDKEEYKPQDKVVVTVKTTNNNQPIQATVNLSIVNDAVFCNESEYDLYLLNIIYEDKYYKQESYSTYIDLFENKYVDHYDIGGERRSRRKR